MPFITIETTIETISSYVSGEKYLKHYQLLLKKKTKQNGGILYNEYSQSLVSCSFHIIYNIYNCFFFVFYSLIHDRIPMTFDVKSL